jgi:hypothetical protein
MAAHTLCDLKYRVRLYQLAPGAKLLKAGTISR